ncbi:Cyclic di-GMP phosphodiesterase response regulator RpfG [Rubripirellula lacrimiformis]|uniref:Cyclic di-GMP phosphodiesterase response regulator RpfG n=2 Tax=Rubripirellula lacrimiformis TaxID=1930273 RepID=A0A517NB91_9BACT|nr:Cyclic di-GMP phosphodiesterase response regulator RpfG [Rubripirellula lacrimiformis]
MADEMERLTEALSIKFEELSLIHQLSEQLKLDEDPATLCDCLLNELAPCITANTLLIDIERDEESGVRSRMFSTGQLHSPDFIRHAIECVEHYHNDSHQAVMVNNHVVVDESGPWRFIVVPIHGQNQLLGRMIAIREYKSEEFGTVEADLMKSTSMMLGVHLVNQRQFMALQHMFEGMIGSLASALDAKDTYTSGHSTRVADLSVELATRLGFDEDGVARIRMAGILHDIGKIGVQDSVLCKPGRLTEDEFEQIKQHPVLGYEILKGIRPFRKILPAVRHHHESWDGTGYPDGLVGTNIPRDAQVLAVADAFDAMTSDRPYRSGMPLDKVVAIFQGGRGQQWAADVVDVLLSCPEVMHAYSKREPTDS